MTVAQLTVPTKGPSFTAKKDDGCRLCHEPIVAGYSFICEIRLGPEERYVHDHCADGHIRTLKANLEVDAGGDL